MKKWNDFTTPELLRIHYVVESTGNPVSAMITLLNTFGFVPSPGLEAFRLKCIAEEGEENGEGLFAEYLIGLFQQHLSDLFTITETEDGHEYALRYNLTKCPYDRIGGKGAKFPWLYAPDDGLDNITLYELAYTFTLYENYLKTGNEEYAYQLLGTLYRTSRPYTKDEDETAWKGDRRQHLRNAEKKIDERAKLFKTISKNAIRLIMFWFASCRESIVSQYPEVFQRSEGGSDSNWGEVLLAIANGPANLDIVADQPYNNALTWLTMQAKAADKP